MKKYFLLLVFLFSAKVISAQLTARDSALMPHMENGDSLPVHNVAEEMPAPAYSVNDFLKENIKYPKDAKKARSQGVTYIHFVVEEDGNITHTSVIKSSGHQSLDDEALRVVAMMPPWKPGTISGKPVRVEVVQPVRFTLNRN
ncbi:MAG TPA: energy transducer TonB [Bacteroidia bacterium]|jgi:TonB family protein|nr:energy transducer TonB [Bacteroidia bacterium]